MQSLQSPYLGRLDHLRFYAAALVVLFHFFHTHAGDLKANNPLLSLIDEGHTGIGLFMVISGFIFTVIARGQEVAWWPFMRNRVVRIYPLFVFAVFLQLMISTYNDHRNYGFVQLLGWLMPFRSETVPLSPYFVQLWTIWVEFQFYLLFPFLHAFANRYGTRYLWGLLGLLLLIRALVFATTGSVRFLAYETIFGRLDQFLIGMLIGRLYLQRPVVAAGGLHPLWPWVAAVAVLAGVHAFSRGVGFTDMESAWWIVWPPVEAALWGGFLWAYLGSRSSLPARLAAPLGRVVAGLGAVSFSTYVMHNLVIAAYNQRLGLLPLGPDAIAQSVWTGLFILLPAVLLLSATTYFLIERPFLSFRGRYLKPLTRPEAAGKP